MAKGDFDGLVKGTQVCFELRPHVVMITVDIVVHSDVSLVC